MLVRVNFKKNEIDKILKTAGIIVDTAEKENKNDHILEYFDKKKIPYKKQKLNYCDYAIYIPAGEFFDKDIYLNHIVTVERKANLTELAGNFTKGRSRFEEEMQRASGRVFLMIENSTYEDIIEHNYRSQYNPKSFIGTLKTFEARYNMSTDFISREKAGEFIYKTLIYQAREYLLR